MRGSEKPRGAASRELRGNVGALKRDEVQHLGDERGSEGPRGIRVQIFGSTKESGGPDENWDAESKI